MIQQLVKSSNSHKHWFWPALVVACLLFAFLTNSQVLAHGGKDHASNTFTGLQALQKATELYDRLITSGKLDASWETDLKLAEVTSRQHQGGWGYRVGFHRQDGNPDAVYIFLSSEGKYTGSNFNGDW